MARLPPSSNALPKLKWQLVGANGLKPAQSLQQDAVTTFIPLGGLHKAMVILRSALLSF